MRIKWLNFLFLFYFLIGDAAIKNAIACEQDYKIYYVNGVANTRAAAIASMKDLKAQVSQATRENGLNIRCLEFGIAYNHSEGMVNDLLEAFVQRGLQSDYPMLVPFIYSYEDLEMYEQLLFEDEYEDAYYLIQEIQTQEFQATDDIFVTLREHTNSYYDDLKLQKKLILVAHSQGNFYANSAYVEMTENILYEQIGNDDNFSIVSVATPANRVRGPDPNRYTTLLSDFIHLVPGALDHNISNQLGCDIPPVVPPEISIALLRNSVECHSFTQAYLRGEVAGNRIIDQIMSLFDENGATTIKNAILVQDANVLDIEESNIVAFFEQQGIDYEVLDPPVILSGINLSTFDNFYFRTGSEPISFNNITVKNGIKIAIESGSRLIVENYGIYLAQYINVPINVYNGVFEVEFTENVSEYLVQEEPGSLQSVFDEIANWVPDGSTEDETQRISTVNFQAGESIESVYVEPVDVGPCINIISPTTNYQAYVKVIDNEGGFDYTELGGWPLLQFQEGEVIFPIYTGNTEYPQLSTQKMNLGPVVSLMRQAVIEKENSEIIDQVCPN